MGTVHSEGDSMKNPSMTTGGEVFTYFDKLTTRSKEVIFSFLFGQDTDRETESRTLEKIVDWVLISSMFCYDECKSPIEEIFNVAYDLKVGSEFYFPRIEALQLKNQAKIVANGNTYYADFLFDTSDCFTYEHDFKLVIECDGHEFHEKTKEQVERGNKRDLDLKKEGYDILHFSGSQIYKDPIGCAEEVINYILKKVGKIEYGTL
jgi:very-short-patch-repair endonuclease